MQIARPSIKISIVALIRKYSHLRTNTNPTSWPDSLAVKLGPLIDILLMQRYKSRLGFESSWRIFRTKMWMRPKGGSGLRNLRTARGD